MSVFMSSAARLAGAGHILQFFAFSQFVPLGKAIVNFGRGAIPIGLKLPYTVVNQEVGSMPDAPA